MKSVRRNPRPQLPSGALLGITVGLLVILVLSTVRHFLDKKAYESAISYYTVEDCSNASQQFSQLINAFRLFDTGNYAARAEVKKKECDFFLGAVANQEAGEFEPALVSYAKLANYEDSALIQPTRNNLADLFEKADIESLATLSVCNRLGNLTSQDLLPDSSEQPLLLYLRCGEIYEERERLRQVVDVYQQILQTYPEHELTGEVKHRLAAIKILDIKERHDEVSYIDSPQPIAITEDGSTLVRIKNSSPHSINITFSGETPRFGEIEQCQDPECVVYTSIREAPESCIQQGPVEEYQVEPGEYEIVVEPASLGNPVNPWYGAWNLEAGYLYFSCFHIIRNLSPGMDQEG